MINVWGRLSRKLTFSKTTQHISITHCQTICHVILVILSQHSVKIVKIHCHSKDMAIMAFSNKCALFLISWENGSIVFKYEAVKFYRISTIGYVATSERSLVSSQMHTVIISAMASLITWNNNPLLMVTNHRCYATLSSMSR